MQIKHKSFLSVIIPVKKLSYTLLFETLPALKKQSYKNFEVIVLPDQHSQYDTTLLKEYPFLRIIPTGTGAKPADKRNTGTKHSKGRIITFIDDDAYPDEDFIKKITALFSQKVAAVCGPGILPPNATVWEKIFDSVLTSGIGSGEYRYRFLPGKKMFTDDYPTMNFSVDRITFTKIGGFRENYWPGEDSKMCEDIVYRKNKKILYHPELIVFHHRKKNLSSYILQHASYGYHRGSFFAQGDRNSRRLSYLLPTIFFFYFISICIYSLFIFVLFRSLSPNILLPSFFFYFPVAIYLFLTLHLSISSFLRYKNIFIAFLAPFVLFTTHILYGIMFAKGFLKEYGKKKSVNSRWLSSNKFKKRDSLTFTK